MKKQKIKQNVLVTGGLGFIGYNVVVKLMNEGHKIAIIDNKTNYDMIDQEELDHIHKERFFSIANRMTESGQLNIYTIDVANPELDKLFNAEQFDSVIHLASFPRQKVVNANPVAGSKVMSEGLLNLLELSSKYNVGRFTYISSSMVYGDFTDNVTEDAVCNPQGQYAIMKYAGELLVKDYTRQHKLPHTIIRPSAVYGPVDIDDRVISKFMTSAMQGKNLTVNGKMEKLDFTFVNDVAVGIVDATLSSKAKNNTYNLTRSKAVSLYEAAQTVSQIVGKGNIDVKQKDKNFPSRGSLSIEKAKNDFDYNPMVDINEGFMIYYNWFLNSTYWQEKINPKPKKKEVIKITPVKLGTPPAVKATVSTKTVTSKAKTKPKVTKKAPTKAKTKKK
jgi:nucleoside-diphosphate-sugar epimerase